MASEAITQNDLREILSRTVGSIPSEYKRLLWANPNPTANFPTQALLSGQDLTVYDAIEVIGINYDGYKSIMPPLQIPIGGKGNLIGLAGSTGDSSGTGYLVMRGISANSNGIVVHGAVGVATNGTSWGANDNNMVPTKIYGIKYERVALPQLGVVPLQVATFQVNTSFVAGAGSLVFNTPLPEGAIIKSRCISRNPNAQWLYCGIHTVSATSTTVAYRNNFSSAFSGIMELSVFYEISN